MMPAMTAATGTGTPGVGHAIHKSTTRGRRVNAASTLATTQNTLPTKRHVHARAEVATAMFFEDAKLAPWAPARPTAARPMRMRWAMENVRAAWYCTRQTGTKSHKHKHSNNNGSQKHATMSQKKREQNPTRYTQAHTNLAPVLARLVTAEPGANIGLDVCTNPDDNAEQVSTSTSTQTRHGACSTTRGDAHAADTYSGSRTRTACCHRRSPQCGTC